MPLKSLKLVEARSSTFMPNQRLVNKKDELHEVIEVNGFLWFVPKSEEEDHNEEDDWDKASSAVSSRDFYRVESSRLIA